MTTPLDLPRIHAICFDLDGTLVDTDDVFVARLARWLRPFAGPARSASAARRIVMAGESPINSMLTVIDRLGIDEPLGRIMRLLHALRGQRDPGDIALIHGVRPMLEALAARYPLALVTAREQASTSRILERLSLERFFGCVATARTCRRTKPHPAPVLWAAERMGLSPQACLMVGDTTPDIRAGRAAGTQTVGVLCGFGERPELERRGADLILPTTADLVQTLDHR
jgi:HAD superfamily hydrolase (TIGR01509 family)